MNKFASISSQILTFFSRLDFEKAVKETKAEQNAKGFTSWEANIQLLSSRFRLTCRRNLLYTLSKAFFLYHWLSSADCDIYLRFLENYPCFKHIRSQFGVNVFRI